MINMKNRILLTVIATVMVTVVFAQDLGKVIIRNGNNSYPKFIVSMNGIRLNNDYNSSITFNYLDDINYRVKVLQAGSSGILNFAVTSAPNYVSKYVLNKDNYGNYSLILESKSLMSSEPEEPVTTVTAVVSANTVIVRPTATVATNPVTVQEPVVPANTITVMEANDYNDRLTAVKNESFDNERLKRAKQVFDQEYFSTSQVIGVMKTFSFDEGKLEFAKFAYSKTLDKKNYYKVQDHLTFSSYKTKLADYIKNNP